MNDKNLQKALKNLQNTLKTFPLPTQIVRGGVAEGIVWVVARGPIGLNGYVRVPDCGHPWSKAFPEGDWALDEHLNVHGGVTFSEKQWIGFDTAHAGDIWSEEYDTHGITRGYDSLYGILWNEDLVVLETLAMANQLASIR